MLELSIWQKGDCLSNLMSIKISIKLDLGDKTISFLSENNNHMIITCNNFWTKFHMQTVLHNKNCYINHKLYNTVFVIFLHPKDIFTQ